MPFAKGVIENLADSVVPIGELTEAENVSFDKAGELIKRGAFRKEPNGVAFSDSAYGSTVTDAQFGTSYKDTMLIAGEKRLWARASDGASEKYYDAGALIPCEQVNEFLNRDGVDRHGPAKVGYVYYSSTPAFMVVAYTSISVQDSAYYNVITEVRDAMTGGLLHRESIDDSAVITAADGLYDIPDPHVCILGSKAFVVYLDASVLKYVGIALTTPVSSGATLAFSAPAALSFAIDPDKPLWDCDVATSAGNATVAGHTSGINTAGCIVVAGLVSDASTGDGHVRVGYFKNAATAADVVLHAVSGSTGTTTYAGSGVTGVAVPDKTTTSAIAGAISISAINESTASLGQLLISSSYFDSGVSSPEIEFVLLGHDLAEDTRMAASTVGVALRSTAWRETDAIIRVALEYAAFPVVGGLKASFRPSDHSCISFEMARSGSTQTTLVKLKSIGFNCSLISESFSYESSRYICVSYTCGKTNSLNGNLFTLLAPLVGSNSGEWTPIAASQSGEQPSNFTTDHQSGLESSLRLFGSLSRVTERISGSGLFAFGSNRFSGLAQTSSATVNTTQEIRASSLVTLDLTPARPLRSLETPNGLLITGGFLHHYDGNSISENGFFHAPVFDSPTPKTAEIGTGSGWVAGFGSIRYRCVYEWYDEMGNLHRSAPSASISASISNASQKVLLSVYVPQFTRKTSGISSDDSTILTGISVAFFRTAADGSLYSRIGSVEIDSTGAYPVVANSRVANFTDYGLDSDTSDHELLYTIGGIPANIFVGSCKDLAMHKERAFVTTSENSVMFSKAMTFRDGVNFSDMGSARVGSEAQSVNAIESAGEAFVIFTDSDGFYITGEGPDGAGVGGFTEPKRFAPGLGAIASSSHLTSAGGAFICTTRGLARILPDLKIDYIGARVEDVIGGDPLNTMCLDESVNEARFFLVNAVSGSEDTIVVYNTLYNQLTVHKVAYAGLNSGTGAFYMDGSLYRVTSDGNVHRYQSKQYTDNCTGSELVYDMNVTTGDINMAGLQSAQRVYRFSVLGNYVSPHTLSLFSYINYSTSTSSSSYETFSQAISADTNPYIYRVHLKNQKCRAVRIRISIHGATATGEAVHLQGLALEIGTRAGTFKLPTAQTLAGS